MKGCDRMDIAGLAMVSNQAKLMNQVSIAVAKLAMDASTQQTNEMAKTMEQSLDPERGLALDIKV